MMICKKKQFNPYGFDDKKEYKRFKKVYEVADEGIGFEEWKNGTTKYLDILDDNTLMYFKYYIERRRKEKNTFGIENTALITLYSMSVSAITTFIVDIGKERLLGLKKGIEMYGWMIFLAIFAVVIFWLLYFCFRKREKMYVEFYTEVLKIIGEYKKM